MNHLEKFVKTRAYALGFDLVGIATLGEAESAPLFEGWLERGYAGEMHYLERGTEKRRDTRSPFGKATSAVVVGLDYGGREAPGPVARYARGDDYHDLMTGRLDELHRLIENEIGHEISGKAYVDTGPILERDLARKAGLGWFGKNSNLINPSLGSFFFIGSLVLDLELQPDAPFQFDRCGSCRACIDACPTDAIVDDRVIDATKCIAYLTIELKSSIPEYLRPQIGSRVYGCDICQEICPWNVSFSGELREPALAPREALSGKDARELSLSLLAMDDVEFRESFRGSPMKRAKLAGLKRNAAVVLGNVGNPSDAPALSEALEAADPMLREHASWALERLQETASTG